MNTIRVSNGLDPDQDQHFVGPDLGPNCLQRFVLSLCMLGNFSCFSENSFRNIIRVSDSLDPHQDQVASLIPARSPTFVEIDHEIIIAPL